MGTILNIRLALRFVLAFLMTWVADAAAQVNLSALDQVILENKGLWYAPAVGTIYTYKHNDKFYRWSGYGHFDVYDKNGAYEGQFMLKFENDPFINQETKGTGVLIGSAHFYWYRDTLLVSSFIGTSFHRADGTQIARTAYKDNGNSSIFFKAAQAEYKAMLFHASAGDNHLAVSFENKIYMPLIVRENRKLRLADRRKPPMGDYLLHARNYRNEAPQMACIDLEGPTENHKRSLKNPFVFAPVDSLAAAQHAKGLYAGYYTYNPTLSIDSVHRKLYYTVSSIPDIWVFDIDSLTVEPVQRLAKHGYTSDSLAWFRTSDMRPFIERGKRDTKNWIDGHRYVSWLSYARSRIDIQLVVDNKRQLLYKVSSQPLPNQDSLFWSKLLLDDSNDSNSKLYPDSIRSRFIQVYDLSQNGQFINEIPVPPLFRILEVDPNGDLWAISAIDSEAVTITKYTVEGWEDED